MYDRVLLPLDGSELSEGIVPYAKQIAKASQITATALLVLSMTQPEAEKATVTRVPSGTEMPVLDYLTEQASAAAKDGIETDTAAVHGRPADEIVRFAEGRGYGLIAMATHGRSGIGRWVYGSTTDKVLYATTLPMLVVRPREEGPPADVTFRRLLLPLDGSELGESVIPHADALARQMSLEVEVVRVVPTATMAYSSGFDPSFYDPKIFDYVSDNAKDYAEQKTAELQEAGLKATSMVLQGHAPTQIVERADAAEGTLIVMSTHGRTGAGRWVLGSVADRVMRASHAPVLLVRSPE